MIVITGLDGSGKSTFHSELEKLSSQWAVLRLPEMDAEKFREDPILFACCKMINELGGRGDKEREPGMKIIAMFSSVVLFNDLFNYLQNRNVKAIFCERHPLVDTCIYARAYHKVMHPSILSLEKAAAIDEQYHLLISEVAQRLHVDLTLSKGLKSHALLQFLHDWFSDEANFVPEKLYRLFEMKKPDEIYFLDAPAEILYDRISNRTQPEHHENVASLEQMRSHYFELLPQFGPVFEIIDATSKIAPNALFARLVKSYCSDN